MAEFDERGEAVLRAAVRVARGLLGERLVSAFALGSLAHGGFAPLVSDVDLALLGTDGADLGDLVEAIRPQVMRLVPGALSTRLSVFHSDWPSVRENRESGRFPALDRRDLLTNGRLLFGPDKRLGAVLPSADQLVLDTARFAAHRFDQSTVELIRHPEVLLGKGVRDVTKLVLFPVRFLFTLHTGEVGHNDDAVDWYAGHGSQADLVRAAGRWRHDGLPAERPAELTPDALAALYREFVDAYLPVVDAPEHADVRTRLTEFRAALG